MLGAVDGERCVMQHHKVFKQAPLQQPRGIMRMSTESEAEEAVVAEDVVDEVAAATAEIVAPSGGAAAVDFSSAIGAQPPLGFFDPLGLLAEADQDRFDRLRYVEIKHGRIAMLAVLGQVTTKAGIFLPGTIDYQTKFSDIPTGIAALEKVPALGWAQIIAFIGALELGVMKDSANGAAPGDFPGDFRNGALDFGWDSFSPEEQASKRAIELNNGRAAQMGILALMVHEELGVSLWPGGI